jgi:hypothetical protein
MVLFDVGMLWPGSNLARVNAPLLSSWTAVFVLITASFSSDNPNVFAANIRKAYLQAASSQKDYIICGSEFGIENVGKVALIYRALYEGTSARKEFRNHLRSCMGDLNFIFYPANPYV